MIRGDKVKKLICSLCLICALFAINTKPIYANAMNISNDSVIGYTVKQITVEPKRKETILNYDVNEHGKILICTDNSASTKKDIYVYSDDGVFEYGYSVSSYGLVKAKWSGENVRILWVRDNIVVEVGPNGEIVQNMEITVNERREYAFSEVQKCNGKEYRIESCGKIPLLNSRLVSIDDDNNMKTIYQTNISYTPFILKMCFGLVLVIAIIVTIIRYWIKTL